MTSWKSQLENGRVFELRSKSKRYPAPCALIVNADASGWGIRLCVPVDELGTIGGDYPRPHNPGISVEGIRREQFTAARVSRRRPDLERFNVDDLALIRYGYALDFCGRIHSTYSDMDVPRAVPSDWTVFGLAAFEPGDFRIYGVWNSDGLEKLLRGAWYYNSHGGARHLGYKFGHEWGTRHQGARLNAIRKFLKKRFPDLTERAVKIKASETAQ